LPTSRRGARPTAAPRNRRWAARRGGAGKREKITITNDKGRLSQDDIKRMVEEAEEFAEQDKKVKGRVDARNQLETYCYNMKTTIEDKLGDKVEPSEKEKARALLGPRGRRVGLGSCGPRPAGTLCAAVAPLLGSSSGGYSEAAARARPRPALPARARASHTAVGRTPTLH